MLSLCFSICSLIFVIFLYCFSMFPYFALCCSMLLCHPKINYKINLFFLFNSSLCFSRFLYFSCIFSILLWCHNGWRGPLGSHHSWLADSCWLTLDSTWWWTDNTWKRLTTPDIFWKTIESIGKDLTTLDNPWQHLHGIELDRAWDLKTTLDHCVSPLDLSLSGVLHSSLLVSKGLFKTFWVANSRFFQFNYTTVF